MHIELATELWGLITTFVDCGSDALSLTGTCRSAREVRRDPGLLAKWLVRFQGEDALGTALSAGMNDALTAAVVQQLVQVDAGCAAALAASLDSQNLCAGSTGLNGLPGRQANRDLLYVVKQGNVSSLQALLAGCIAGSEGPKSVDAEVVCHMAFSMAVELGKAEVVAATLAAASPGAKWLVECQPFDDNAAPRLEAERSLAGTSQAFRHVPDRTVLHLAILRSCAWPVKPDNWVSSPCDFYCGGWEDDHVLTSVPTGGSDGGGGRGGSGSESGSGSGSAGSSGVKPSIGQQQPQDEAAPPAAPTDYLRVVQLLLAAGADVNAPDDSGYPPLLLAARLHARTSSSFPAAITPTSPGPCPAPAPPMSTAGGVAPAPAAAVGIVQALIAAGADVNTTRRPMAWDIMRAIHRRAWPPSIGSYDTPLKQALHSNAPDPEVVRLLLDAGAQVPAYGGGLLPEAEQRGCPHEIVQMLQSAAMRAAGGADASCCSSPLPASSSVQQHLGSSTAQCSSSSSGGSSEGGQQQQGEGERLRRLQLLLQAVVEGRQQAALAVLASGGASQDVGDVNDGYDNGDGMDADDHYVLPPPHHHGPQPSQAMQPASQAPLPLPLPLPLLPVDASTPEVLEQASSIMRYTLAWAARLGQMPVVHALLRDRMITRPLVLGTVPYDVARVASEKRHCMWPQTNTAVTDALVAAAYHGHAGVVKELLACGVRCGDAVLAAAASQIGSGQCEALEVLLINERLRVAADAAWQAWNDVAMPGVRRAALAAAKAGNQPALELLLAALRERGLGSGTTSRQEGNVISSETQQAAKDANTDTSKKDDLGSSCESGGGSGDGGSSRTGTRAVGHDRQHDLLPAGRPPTNDDDDGGHDEPALLEECLTAAVDHGHSALVSALLQRLLLHARSSPGAGVMTSAGGARQDGGCAPGAGVSKRLLRQLLIRAAGAGRVGVVSVLLAAGAAPDAAAWGWTPLLAAQQAGQYAAAAALVAAGADVGLTRRLRMACALHCSAAAGDVRVVRRLLRAGAAVDGPQAVIGAEGAGEHDHSPLYAAVEGGHDDVLEVLLAAGGVDVELGSATGGITPLFKASQESNAEAVRMLLATGANPNTLDTTTGRTPLIEQAAKARWGARHDVMQALIDGGADVNATDLKGRSALMAVVSCLEWHENDGIVELLLAAGARVELRDREGRTALDLLANGIEGVRELLLAAAATAAAAAVACVKAGVQAGMEGGMDSGTGA